MAFSQQAPRQGGSKHTESMGQITYKAFGKKNSKARSSNNSSNFHLSGRMDTGLAVPTV